MTLIELRKLLVDLTGRFDLVDVSGDDDTTYEDNGADFFLNAGQRYLDDHPLAPKIESVAEVSIAALAYEAFVPNLRAVRRAWYQPLGMARVELERQTMQELYDRLTDVESIATVPPDAALFYAEDERRATSNVDADVWSKRLVLMPPTLAPITLYVEGLFYTPPLIEDGDSSYWSVQHPDLLLKAAAYEMEGFHRNRTGAADYRMQIEEKLVALDMNTVQNQIGDGRRMRYGW